MAWYRLVTVAFASSLALSACGDDGGKTGSSGTGTEGSGSTGSTGSSGGTSEGSGGASSGGSGGSGSGSSTGAASTGGATTVTLFGEVTDRVLDTPIADAAISVDGMPGFETVSGADGTYTIEGLPPDTELFVIIDPTVEFFGSVVPVLTEAPGDQEQALAQVSHMFVDAYKDLVESMGMLTLDETKGVIFARVIQNTAVMEGPITVDLTPMPAMDSYFAPDGSGNPVLNSNQAQYNLLPVVIFANLDEADAGTYSLSASHPVRDCQLPHPTFPVKGTHVTLADVDCPPV